MKSNSSSDDARRSISHKRARSGKSRIDVLIVERGLAPSREKAQAMLLAGNILVHGQKIEKPGAQIDLPAFFIVRKKMNRAWRNRYRGGGRALPSPQGYEPCPKSNGAEAPRS